MFSTLYPWHTLQKLRHKSTPFFRCRFRFWYACHAYLEPDSPGVMQIPAPIGTLFYLKPESVLHITKMMTCDLFLFNSPLASTPAAILAAVTANSLTASLSAVNFRRQKFHSRLIRSKNRCRSGARKWSWFMAPVSTTCVMGSVA